MYYHSEELKSMLEALPGEDVIGLVTEIYYQCPAARSLIHQAVITKDNAGGVLDRPEMFTAGECKTALSRYLKTIKGRKEKVECYFTFIERVLDKKDTLDFRFISFASASFGKALEILERDKSLWEEMLDRSFAIACRFNQMPGAAPYKAVEYYHMAKQRMDRKES